MTEPLLIVVLVQAAVIAALGLRWFLENRPVTVIREGEYKGGQRTFVKARLITDGSVEGTYLADAATGYPLTFVGLTAWYSQTQFRAGGKRANATVYLQGVEIERLNGKAAT